MERTYLCEMGKLQLSDVDNNMRKVNYFLCLVNEIWYSFIKTIDLPLLIYLEEMLLQE